MIIDTHIAGVSHAKSGKDLDRLATGAPLELVREPTNKFDAFAVMIVAAITDGEATRKIKAGYVPGFLSKKVAKYMDGKQHKLTAFLQPGNKVQIHITDPSAQARHQTATAATRPGAVEDEETVQAPQEAPQAAEKGEFDDAV